MKIGGLEHPRGSDHKTRQLISQMSEDDLRIFPIEVAKMDLGEWHRQVGESLRQQIVREKENSAGNTAARL